jgi:hypothetical protein
MGFEERGAALDQTDWRSATIDKEDTYLKFRDCRCYRAERPSGGIATKIKPVRSPVLNIARNDRALEGGVTPQYASRLQSSDPPTGGVI